MYALLKRNLYQKSYQMLALTLLCCLFCPLNCDDNAKENTDEATGADPQAEVETVDVPAAAAPNDISSLTEAKCAVKRKGCCDELFIGDEEIMTKCLTLHQDKIPAEDEKNPQKLFKFLSCLVECTYKQKKYIGKGDNVNMKMVKADAAKEFADRPKEKEYHIKMFEFCRKDAMNLYGVVKMSPAGQVLLKDNCKPYFLFVFLCQVDYHKKKSCPYFRWEGKAKTDAEITCLDARHKCYEIDGISA